MTGRWRLALQVVAWVVAFGVGLFAPTDAVVLALVLPVAYLLALDGEKCDGSTFLGDE